MDKLHYVLIGVIVLLFLGLIGLSGSQQGVVESTQTITKTVSASEAITTTVTQTSTLTSTITTERVITTTVTERAGLPYEKGKWNKIAEFKGSSDKTTELFKIPSNQWRVNWTVTAGQYGGSLSIWAYAEGGRRVESVISIFAPHSDSTMIYRGPGNFYLELDASLIGEYVIKVEAWIPE